MNQLPILLKREFWEHKGVFLYLPLAISAVVILLLLLTASMNISFGGEVTVDSSGRQERDFEWQSDARPLQDIYFMQIKGLSQQDEWKKEEVVRRVLTVVTSPVRGILWFVVIYYLMGSLYEDRKDRSVLFWKSMPVSDTMTVVSKLLAAVVVAPVIAFALLVATQVSLLVIASILAISADVSVWGTLWGPAQLHTYWPLLLAALSVQAFWSLPIYGFVMLVSCYARSIPLIWLLAVPAVISLVESILLRVDWFRSFLVHHMKPLSVGAGDSMSLRNWSDLLEFSFSLEMAFGVLVGAALLWATIWLRGRNIEI